MATTVLGEIHPAKFHEAMRWLWDRREQANVKRVAIAWRNAEEDDE
jgi:hypothetical protein